MITSLASGFRRYQASLSAALLLVVVSAMFLPGAHAGSLHTDPTPDPNALVIPGNTDGSLLTHALAPFVAIAGAAVLAVLALKFAPRIVKYVFKWVVMALR